jgi:hypothetical protein
MGKEDFNTLLKLEKAGLNKFSHMFHVLDKEKEIYQNYSKEKNE